MEPAVACGGNSPITKGSIYMNRKIKALGLALVAALALTAVMASTASAQFTSSAAHTTLSGSQTTTHTFTAGTGIGAINCETATFAGTQTGTSSSTVTIIPTYGPTCKDSLGRVVHILKNTLEYHFLSGTGKGHVELTGHIELTVTTGFGHCTITIQGPQTINGITYTQSGNDLTVSTHSNNITSSIAGGGFACGTSATHSSTGTYTGSTLMKGNGGAAKISID
jgi:hypothetical protein